MREPAKESTPLALLLVHRERLLSDVMVGGCYGHKMAVFNSQRTKEVGQQNCYLQLLEGTLVSLGDCLRESLVSSCERVLHSSCEGKRGPGRLDIL